MRRGPGNISPTALHWIPEGKRKRGWPKNTWLRTVESELKTLHHTWGTIQKLAQNRQELTKLYQGTRFLFHNAMKQ